MKNLMYIIAILFGMAFSAITLKADAASAWNYTCLDMMNSRQIFINGTDKNGEYLRMNDMLMRYTKKSPNDASIFTDGKNCAYVLWVRPGLTIITYSAPDELPVSFTCGDEVKQ